jgi:hypothetical protein
MSLTPATQELLGWPFRILRTEVGRRVAAAMLVSVTLATTVQTMYANADAPAVAAAAGQRLAVAGAADGRASGAGAARRPGASRSKPAKPTEPTGSKPASPAKAGAADAPAKVAVAWYARKRGVAADKVTLLQQRRKNDNEVRVLVMVELGDRLDTAEVKVRRGKNGWKVP